MEFIEEVLMLALRSNKGDRFSTILATLFFFAALGIIVTIFNGSPIMGLMLFLGTFIAPTIGFLLGMKVSKKLFKRNFKKVEFKDTKLYKELEKNAYLYDFMNTINDEIKSENTIKYYSDIQGIGLLITETWFVFIDTKHPVVTKTAEIVKISEEFSTSNSRHFLCLELKDKTYLRIDELSCDDIEDEIKNKYPNIMIGIGIIEE